MSLKERLSTIHDIVTQPRKRCFFFKENDRIETKRQRIIEEAPLLLKGIVQRTNKRTTDKKKESKIASEDSKVETARGGKVDSCKLEATANLLSSDFVADEIVKDFIGQVKDEIDTVEEDIQDLEKKRIATIKKQSKVWETYLYGLQEISNLTDLRHAPDAIMPGNF